VTEGDTSFLALFSTSTRGVMVCETLVGEGYGSMSSRVFSSHSIWFMNFSILGLGT
jgi:hypothetical protein